MLEQCYGGHFQSSPPTHDWAIREMTQRNYLAKPTRKERCKVSPAPGPLENSSQGGVLHYGAMRRIEREVRAVRPSQKPTKQRTELRVSQGKTKLSTTIRLRVSQGNTKSSTTIPAYGPAQQLYMALKRRDMRATLRRSRVARLFRLAQDALLRS